MNIITVFQIPQVFILFQVSPVKGWHLSVETSKNHGLMDQYCQVSFYQLPKYQFASKNSSLFLIILINLLKASVLYQYTIMM